MKEIRWVQLLLVFLTVGVLLQQFNLKSLSDDVGTIAIVVDHMVGTRTANVTLTAYSAEVRQTDSTPEITSFLTPVKPWTVALSWDLIQAGFTPGKCIQVVDGYEVIGVFRINDRMASYWHKRVDIFFWDTETAWRFGLRSNAQIILVEHCAI